MSKKTVVDAVNELRGDFENAYKIIFSSPLLYLTFDCDHDRWCATGTKKEDLRSGYEFVCTIDEFNQCVAEMSEGLFVPDYRQKTPEIQYDKDGNGWEIGSVYEFSNDKKDWYQASFSRLDRSGTEYKPHGLNWHLFARECQSPIGKVHRKPVELVDGAVYQFESFSTGRLWVGFYNSADFAFYESTGGETNPVMIGSVQDFKNIIRLVPEVK
jgi:hypothetical protein